MVRSVVRSVATAVIFSSAFLVLLAGPARADNCDLRINPEDCQNTAWTVGTVAATAAAITAILTALSGLGGTGGGAGVGVAGRTVQQVAAGGPPRDPPDGYPPIYQQQTNDSCAIVCVRMVVERLTGESIPENALRAQSHLMGGGYRTIGNWGTPWKGPAALLDELGVPAEQRALTPGQMQETLASGRQIIVAHGVPGGGGHSVVLSRVEPRGDRYIMTFDDPWTGKQFQRTDMWWNSNQRPQGTVVVGGPK